MPNYKLTYYDSPGLAEPIRLIFAYAKVSFEDVRIPVIDRPPPLPQEIKERCPWGQVPLLEIDGNPLAQSTAITRFVAKTFNLVGADDFEAAKCDEYVDTILDLSKGFHPVYHERDQQKKAEMLKTLINDISSKYLTKFNDIVAANGGKGLVGNSLTWADIVLVSKLHNAETELKINILQGFSALKSLKENVYSLPQIKEWVKKHQKKSPEKMNIFSRGNSYTAEIVNAFTSNVTIDTGNNSYTSEIVNTFTSNATSKK